MIYPVTAYGHPVLRKKAREIDRDYPDLNTIIENMFETMYASNGVGLAAPQVNLSISLVVIDADPYKEEYAEVENFKKVLINPEIIDESGEEWEFKESCLSIPTVAEYVSRRPEITIKYYDENFELHEEKYCGMIARVMQHETDHLNGILFTDKINNLKKVLIRKKLVEISNGNVDTSYKMLYPKKKRKK